MARQVLQVTDLAVDFPTDEGVVRAVRGLSFSVAEREVLGIVGESGSGKSVTCLAVLGLLPGSARITGSVTLDGRALLGADARAARRLRGNSVAMIFQDPMTAMNPVATVGHQLSEAYRAHHGVTKRAAEVRAVAALDLVGIPQAARRAASYPHEFSGGMRQRAMIAMAIINDPAVILADEPTTALDVTVQAQILELLVEIKERVAAAVVLITHDLGVVAGIANRVLVMYAGRSVETCSVTDLFAEPRHPYTEGLLGSIPTPGGGRLVPIRGAPPSMVDLPPGCPFAPRCRYAAAVCETEPPLLPTDRADHRSACHRWPTLAGESQ